MRKYLALITEDKDGSLVGRVETRDTPFAFASKNEETMCRQRNLETDETWMRRYVGLGYVDVDSEPSPGVWSEIMQQKLAEIDEEFLDKAGVELEGDSA